MNKEKHIIYSPGLFDHLTINQLSTLFLPFFWKIQGYNSHIIKPRWNFRPFEEILADVTQTIDDLKQKNPDCSIYLIGQSAGGSLMANAYSQRRDKIDGVANTTGRLRRGINVKPTLEKAARYSPAFKKSVELFEDINEKTLTPSDRKKFITIRPHLDFVVPASTVPLEGATNITAPIIDHSIGGGFINSFYSWRIFKFFESI